MLWVFDKQIEHDDPRMVYLFNTYSGVMKGYERSFARSRFKTVKDSQKQNAIEIYLGWHEKNGADFLERDRERARREVAQQAAQQAAQSVQKAILKDEKKKVSIERHKKFLEELGLAYQGFRETEGETSRFTNCWNCKSHLTNDVNIQCAACDWLICDTCGACGCGYSNRD